MIYSHLSNKISERINLFFRINTILNQNYDTDQIIRGIYAN